MTSESLDEVIEQLSWGKKKKLNKKCMEMFNITNLKQRKKIDKLHLLMNIHWAKYHIDDFINFSRSIKTNGFLSKNHNAG